VTPHGTRKSKPKVAWRGMMMGYAECDGQKGYKVRRLSDGKIINVARERVARFYEFSILYPREHDYDAWLEKQVKKVNKDEKKIDKNDNIESENDESESDLEYDESGSEFEIDENNDDENDDENGDVDADDEDGARVRHEPASVSGLPSAEHMLARMELGMPPLAPPTPRATRAHTIASENESDSSSVSDGEGGGSGGARVSVPASPTHRSGSDSAFEAPLDISGDDSSNGKSVSNDDDEASMKLIRF
jgi:hypothetical protein